MSSAAQRDDTEPPASAPAGNVPPTARISPYMGLTPFEAGDAAYFFGRESESRIIAANLVASRLTVLYGASGVGKSSLLHAGVGRDLRMLATRNRAEHGVAELVPVVFGSWHDEDVVAALRHAVFDAVEQLTGRAPGAGASLAEDLEACADLVGGEVLLILDQFEEYFLYHPYDEATHGFDAQLSMVLTRPELQANVMISIREDAVAQLDRFKGRIPDLFGNYLRVRHLDRAAARSAIEKPVQRFNADHAAGPAIEIEDGLIEQVLHEVGAGRVVLENEGRGGVDALDLGHDDARVETPYLQLVMTRLWHEDVQAGSHVLRRATLERLGGAAQIVRAHLDTSLARLGPAERDLAARSFHHLVTPSGAKVAHAPADLAKYAGVDEGDLVRLLERLSHGTTRILRPVAVDPNRGGGVQYEIFHDVLAAPILDWRQRHVADAERVEAVEQRKAAERLVQAERRRTRTFRGLAIASALFALAAGVAVVLALRAADEARSQKLASEAISLLSIDPAESIDLATEALDDRVTPEAQIALRAALEESRASAVLTGHTDSVWSARYSRDGKRILTASDDGTARLWAATGHQLGAPLPNGPGLSVALLDDGGALVVTAGLDGVVRGWDAITHRRLWALKPRAGPLSPSTVDLSSDGRYVITPGAKGKHVAVIWDARTGRRLRTLRHGHDAVISALAFSHDRDAHGRTVVATGSSDGSVQTWNAATAAKIGRPIQLPRKRATAAKIGRPIQLPRKRWVDSLEFSMGARRLLVSADDRPYLYSSHGRGTSLPVNFDTGLPLAHFSPDGTLVVTAGDKTTEIWRADSGKRVAVLSSKKDYVYSASFSPNSRMLVTGEGGGIARVWSRGGQLLTELRGHTDVVWDARFSPDSRSVLTAGADGTARTWNDAPESGMIYRRHRGSITSATFSADGRRVLTASADGTARLWDAQSGDDVLTAGASKPPVPTTDAALARDGESIVVATLDGGVWYYPKGEGVVRRVPGLPGANLNLAKALAVGLDPAGRRLVVVGQTHSGENVAWISDLDGGDQIRLDVHAANEITSAEFSPNGRRVVTSGVDKRARIFRARDGKLLHTLGEHADERHSGIVWHAHWSHNGRRVVTAGNDGTVRIWDASSGTQLRVLAGFVGAASDAAFGNHDHWIVGVGTDGSTRIWDVASGQVLGILRRHREPLNLVAVRSTDNAILTAGDDKTARIYHCATCVSLARLRRDLIADRRAARRAP